MGLTIDEIKVILKYLDRAPVTGKNERMAMDIVVEKLETFLIPQEEKPRVQVPAGGTELDEKA